MAELRHGLTRTLRSARAHAEDAGEGRLVVVTLQKIQRTSANGHWKCVCLGEPEIDTAKFGPAVMTADPNDPGAIARMLQEGGLG